MYSRFAVLWSQKKYEAAIQLAEICAQHSHMISAFEDLRSPA